MKTYTSEQLAEILGKHRSWLLGEEGGERANLRGANLRGANLSDAYLSDANLRGAYLSGANLSGANLSGANLSDANLSGANLSDANLRGANLSDANLRGANLSDANLSGANLRGAYLSGAYLSDANLSGAYLSELSSIWGISGNCREVKAIQCDYWPVTYTAERMQIGCQFHTLAEWWSFTDEEIGRMDSKALDWWQVWKPILQNIITLAPAVPGGAAPEPTTEAA